MADLPHDLLVDLQCPITVDWLDEPVCVPCCQRAFSRAALAQALEGNPRCPLCNTDLEDNGFNVWEAPINRQLAGLVETARQQREVGAGAVAVGVAAAATAPQINVWSASYVSVRPGYGRLQIGLEGSTLQADPALFVLLADFSGSMSGTPEVQLRQAIRYIYDVSAQWPQVCLRVVRYDSSATNVDLTGSTTDVYQRISGLRASGGTSFTNAFRAFCDLARQLKYRNTNIAFMTDGQDYAKVEEIRKLLVDTGMGSDADVPASALCPVPGMSVTVHSIGFGAGCNKEILDQIRKVGTTEGTFRYAEPTDSEDALCNKIAGVFDLSCAGSVLDIEVCPVCPVAPVAPTPVKLAINSNGVGQATIWTPFYTSIKITGNDINVSVDVQHRTDSMSVASARDTYFERQIDRLAADILAVRDMPHDPDSLELLEVHCALFRKTAKQLAGMAGISDRVAYLETQIEALATRKTLDVGRLSDLKFSSMFAGRAKTGSLSIAGGHVGGAAAAAAAATCRTPALEARVERPLRDYTRASGNTELMTRICYTGYAANRPLGKQARDPSITAEAFTTVNSDGNNLIMLLAYRGLSYQLEHYLECYRDIIPATVLTHANNDSETAFTIAVKARGFDRTLALLLNHGAVVIRKAGIIRFAIEAGYTRTARLVDQMEEGSGSGSGPLLTVDASMRPEYLVFMAERLQQAVFSLAADQPETLRGYLRNHLDVFLSVMTNDPERYLPLIRTLLDTAMARELLTVDDIINHGITNKPDSPNIPHYLEVAKIALFLRPDLIHARNADGETLLFSACKRGSLPHVQLFAEMGSDLEAMNDKRNTPLWIASYQRFPCIMTYLMDRGANIMHRNEKDNGLFYGVCERGGVKVAELLISRGVPVDSVNANGDTLILLCCRNGQSEVLQLLLNYVEPEFVDFRAHIDGFNAIMASAEVNRPQCISVLADYGVNLLQTTSDDNAILRRATPLHIAAYYGRADAIRMLLQWAGPQALDVQDINGQTPLHIAVIQGLPDIISLLIGQNDQQVLDNSGQPAMAYCRDDIRELFTDPLTGVFDRLARAGISNPEREAAMCDIIQKYLSDPARLEVTVDIADTHGFTPLMHAAMHGRIRVAEMLLALGANPTRMRLGLSATFWAHHLRNVRLARLLTGPSGTEDSHGRDVAAKRETLARQPYANILFMAGPPPYQARVSTLTARMSATAGAFLSSASCPLRLGEVQVDAPLQAITNQDTLWVAKICTIVSRLEAQHLPISIPQALIISTYVNGTELCTRFTEEMAALSVSDSTNAKASPQLCLFYQALQALPAYIGEVYLGLSAVDRSQFQVGQTISWQTTISVSTLWRVALSNVPQFSTKSRKGVVFIIRGRTTRLVSRWSLTSGDAEGILLPGVSYRVTAWYHGDIIALGQENIRAHSYAVEEVAKDGWQNIAEMTANDKSLIIELTED